MQVSTSLVLSSLVTAALILVVVSGCSKEVVGVKLPPVVSTQEVSFFTPEITDVYSAVIGPAVQVDLAFRGSGYVDSIHKVRAEGGVLRNVQEGDYVRRGTVLACLRQGDYLSRVRQQSAAVDEVRLSDERARATLAEANAVLSQAREEYQRASRLYQSNSITKPEYEAASAKLTASEARVREARAQISVNQATARRTGAGLDEARLALKDCTLTSPTDGTILKRSIEEGTLASTGTVAFTIADTRSVKVSFGVPDVKLKDITMGEELPVTTEAVPGQVFRGRVTDIAPAADPKSRVFNVEVTIANASRALKPGMVASLQTGESEPQAPSLSIPLSAVIKSSTNPDGYAVFVVSYQDGKSLVEERQVKLGEASGLTIAVLEGLKQKERVVVNGTSNVVSGQEVRILR